MLQNALLFDIHLKIILLVPFKVQNVEKSVGSSGGSKGAGKGRVPPWGTKFFQFHAVFGKFWQNRMLAPLPGS